MLEGQVAILGSGLLPAADKLTVLEALFAGGMYRPDQNSFMLYPERRLPSFLDKNVVPQSDVAANPLLSGLIDSGNTSVVQRDAAGRYRFNADFRNERDLAAALDRLAEEEPRRELVVAHRDAVMRTYEAVFNHHAYAGRSGSMYAYEGIGSIYWHMVAKLLVVVQESILEATDENEPADTVDRLVEFYWRIRSGLGFEKTAVEFGAFPMDPYSHTPKHAGAQQPGMTGQVKEEILTRSLELGLRIESGEITFDPILLRPAAFLKSAGDWQVRLGDGSREVLELQSDTLGFTVCQVPVIVSRVEGPAAIEIEGADGSRHRTDGLVVDRQASKAIFERSGGVAVVRAFVPKSALSDDYRG